MKRIVLLVSLAVLLLAGCDWWHHEPSPVYVTGEMRVEGTVTHANIFFRAFDGVGMNEQYEVALPWSYTDDHAQAEDSFYLSAQSSDAAGDLTISVLIDGVPLASETTAAPFGFVAIYGVIP